MMNVDRLRPLFVLGAFAAAPFLVGAGGKGCQPIPSTGDAGSPVADAGPGDGGDGPEASDGGGLCVSPAGGPCGGFTQAPCTCAPGLACQTNRIPDIPGVCVAPPDAACVDNVLCIASDHWDPVLCACVPDVEAGPGPDAACVDNVLCIRGDHWDPIQCKCVPAAPTCTTAADCHGALPQLCLQSCDGGPGACAHFACKDHACETVICE